MGAPTPVDDHLWTSAAFRASLWTLAAVTLALVVYMVVIGTVEHDVRQTTEYSQFRRALATGTAPTGQTDSHGHLLAAGTPVALLQIPSIGLSQVVAEGTSSETLMGGPGHLRDTPLPGQPGISVIVGRQAAFGGPFGRLHDLKAGAGIKVTVGFGSNVEFFKILDVRRAGDPAPPSLADGASRLVLVTGDGIAFAPGGLMYVDADLTSAVQPASPQVLASSALPSSNIPGRGDTTTIWALVLWLQLLLLVVAGATWSWYRWGRRQTWTVFFPAVLVIGFFVSDQIARVLPNVL